MAQRMNKKTAQQIVETVKDVCGQDINYIDTDGMVYVSTNPNRVGSFHEIGKRVADTGQTIEVKEGENFYGTKPGVNIPIAYKGNIIAVIGISGNPDNVRKFAYLAQRITILLLREQELDRRENDARTRMNYIIRSLTGEEADENGRVEEYLNESKFDVEVNYRLIYIQLDRRYNPNNLGLIESRIETAFRFLETELYTYYYPNEYIAIVRERTLQGRKQILEKLSEECAGILKIAVSDGHSIYEQKDAYTEARITIKSLRGKVSLLYYSELGLEILCSAAEETLSRAYCEKYLGKLEERDLSLLKVYYEENMSLTKTSEKLFLHKNTIQYQLDKIYRITGYNPRNFIDGAGFYSAILMQEL